jgi:transcription elongation GreA/GreB family factor
MSVAFRREGDDEHKEPEFELPIPVGPNLVTPRGLALIAARVIDLEALIAATADEAEVKKLRRDLRYWNTRHATAQPMPPAEDDGEVRFGTRVRYRIDGTEQAIDIVGHDEADPANGRIAFSAPLARAMIGAAEGESVDWAGKRIELVEVAPLSA